MFYRVTEVSMGGGVKNVASCTHTINCFSKSCRVIKPRKDYLYCQSYTFRIRVALASAPKFLQRWFWFQWWKRSLGILSGIINIRSLKGNASEFTDKRFSWNFNSLIKQSMWNHVKNIFVNFIFNKPYMKNQISVWN